MNQKAARITVELPSGARARELSLEFRAPLRQLTTPLRCIARLYQDGQSTAEFPVDFTSDSRKRWDLGETTSLIRIEFVGKVCAQLLLEELSVAGELPVEKRLTWGLPEVLLGDGLVDFRYEPKSLGPLWKQGMFPSLSATCTAQKRLASASSSADESAEPSPADSECTDRGSLAPTGPIDLPFKAVHDVVVGESSGAHPHFLFVETDRGFFPTNVALDAGTVDPRAAATYAYRITRLETRQSRLWVVLTRRRADFFGWPGSKPYDVVAEVTYVCALTDKLLCHRAISAFGETVATTWSRASWQHQAPMPPFQPKPWTWKREVSVGPTGALRLGVCRDEDAKSVACQVTGLGHILTE